MPLDLAAPMLSSRWDAVFTEAEDYYWTMAARNRCLILSDGASILGTCTFFVLSEESDVERFRRRPMWSTPPDAQDGSIIYLDKLATTVWNHRLARAVEREVSMRVPGWRVATWYRPTEDVDRRFTYRRRR